MSAQPQLHPTAIISPDARLAAGVQVGPYAVIGADVVVGEDTAIGPHSIVEGPTVIGSRNRIIGQVSIGVAPQDLKYKGEPTVLEIGDGNVIREFVTIHRGTPNGGGRTTVGDRNLLMVGVHIAHDCHVGNEVIMANLATLAGHVEVGNYSTVGASVGVHQFCRVGEHAFIGGYSVLTQDALPFVKTVGERTHAKTYDVNRVGLERRGFSAERIDALKKAYRWLLRRGLRLEAAVARIREEGLETPDVALLLRFIETSERGFVR